MANPAPVLRISGSVHADPIERTVAPLEARPARPAERNEFGVVTKPYLRAIEARDGYTVHDVTVLTRGGGFVTIVFREEAVQEAGGYLPGAGDVVEDLPVLSYVKREYPSGGGAGWSRAGFSFAGSVYAEEARERVSKTGSRVASVG